jgi:hypothetical protein
VSIWSSCHLQAHYRLGPGSRRHRAAQSPNAWPAICDLFALQLLGLAEELRPALDSLEGDEDDPDRLKALYQVDHAVTRMRRAARDMRILTGREDEELSGYTSSLVDVLRAAESSIERYDQISIGKMVELAVMSYAADDLASLLAALLDNATTYSPATVTVAAGAAGTSAPGDPAVRTESARLRVAGGHRPVEPARREAEREEARQVMASGGLPRRERTSLRGPGGGAGAPARTTTGDQAAAGRSFADDLAAYTNMMLGPLPDHVQRVLATAAGNQVVGDRFAHGYADPSDFQDWLMDPGKTDAYLSSVAPDAAGTAAH